MKGREVKAKFYELYDNKEHGTLENFKAFVERLERSGTITKKLAQHISLESDTFDNFSFRSGRELYLDKLDK